LLRILGVGFGLAVIVGNTIGGGILRTPGEVAERLPNPWLFIAVWVAGGLYALLGTISIAELGTMIPRSGGQYVFARRALGDYAGFVVGWSDWISTCGTSAFVSVVIAEYLGVLFPRLEGQNLFIATAIVVAFGLLQWRGLRWGSATQNVTSLLKALAFVALILSFFIFGGGREASAVETNPVRPGAPLFAAFIIAMQSVIYTYDGWTGVIYFSEEVRDPSKNIPRSMFGGVMAVIAIYLLVNLALLYVLPIEKIAGENLAVGTAATEVFGATGDTVIRSLTIISMLSAINACQLMATRVLFAMGRDGLFAKIASAVNEGGTPGFSLLVSTAVALLFVLSGKGRIDRILAILAFFFVVNYAVSFLSLFVLRRREPECERPYRAWGYPWTTAVSLIGSVAFLISAVIGDQENSRYALGVLALSYPAFLLIKRTTKQVS
jgi:APA family basic amino acid/polyamine antiporter